MCGTYFKIVEKKKKRVEGNRDNKKQKAGDC